ncbi:MAG: RdgB/HAM1 family non-canonical purine pyrophosphatase, dITP/XTP pyrophosphatase [Candidatus Saccharibacteria bacterium]|nr:RdgB/HAM1 family non-canonical purine pyrophosphatase, dITP/XTP pyrophosphatase [Candidatus Saccharibacteria bacterium]
MPDLTFVTGNADKLSSAIQVSAVYGISLKQASPEVEEVQGEDPEHIARRKAEVAFELLRAPLVVSDDSWWIHGLNGFPGPYMKSMNHWLNTDDFLRLTAGLTDRSVTLTKLLVYQDEETQKIIRHDVQGQILTESRGNSNVPWAKLVVLNGDHGRTIAEVYEQKIDLDQRQSAQVWHSFFEWYKQDRV